jgi:hypothetical protein
VINFSSDDDISGMRRGLNGNVEKFSGLEKCDVFWVDCSTSIHLNFFVTSINYTRLGKFLIEKLHIVS